MLGIRAWHLRRSPNGDRVWSWREAAPLVGAGIVLFVAALQLVPLPRALIALLSPDTGALFDRDEAAAGIGAALRPLSLEPVATWRALLLGLAYVAVFLVARAVGGRRRIALHVALSLGILGALVSLYALVLTSELPIADRWERRPRAPFLNPNHLCTFLTLSLGPALAAVIAPEGEVSRRAVRPLHLAFGRRGLAGLTVLLIVVGLFLSQSRAGLLAALCCVGLTLALSGALTLPAPWPGAPLVKRVHWRLVGVAMAAIALGIGVLAADARPLLERMQSTEIGWEGRLANWGVALRVARGHPLAGSGLATFDDASLAVLAPDHPRTTRPESAHNDYLELATDVGVPAALLAICCVLALVVWIGRGLSVVPPTPRAVAAGCLGAACGALVHALFDFGLQIPGPALLFATCLGLAAGLGLRAEAADREQRKRRLLVRAGLAGLLSLVAAAHLAQTWSEAGAQEAYRRMRAKGLKGADVRRGLAERADPLFRSACGRLSPAVLFQEHADVACHLVPADGALALARAREAVARAPGRSHAQMLLAWLLLDERWKRSPKERAEGEARMNLALDLGPILPQVLLLAGQLELDRFVETGEGAARDRAEDLLARALAREPRLRPQLRAILSRREARLGAWAAGLRSALGIGP